MGIGTSDTLGTALTVKRDKTGHNIFKAIGNDDGTDAFVITSSGNIGIGTATPGLAKVAVMDGYVGIGTTAPSASLMIVNPSANE